MAAPLLEPLQLRSPERPFWRPPPKKRLAAADLTRLEVSFRSREDGCVYRTPLGAAGEFLFEQTLPSRKPPVYRDQKHMPGLHWSAKTDEHVFYESRLERSIMLALDYSSEVVSYAAQPLRFHYRPPRGRARQHVPDIFVRLVDGSAVLIDVVPSEFAQSARRQRGFDISERACALLGWQYLIQAELDPIVGMNLDGLSGYRREPVDLELLAPAILKLCDSSPSLDELLAAFGSEHERAVLPVVFHLLYRGDLRGDLAEPITGRTLLQRTND